MVMDSQGGPERELPHHVSQQNGHQRPRDTWIYPRELANDLDSVAGLSEQLKQETYTCAWEYARCVIPEFSNWDRYLAFTRIIIIGIVAEFNGALVDVSASDRVLGYNLSELFATIFSGTPAHEAMAREYRAFLLVTAEKSGLRSTSALFTRYVESLVVSPKAWFRLRDCDALARFTIAAALACNDFDDVWFDENQLQVLTEIGDTLYDAVAFYKHRAEAETNNTFAYVSEELRVEAFRRAREVLWALDVAWARSPAHRCVINFLRLFGGPIYMMMRRYRFVEDGLMVGKAETEQVVNETRRNVKLWNRVEVGGGNGLAEGMFRDALAQRERVMFEGLAEMLTGGEKRCCRCKYKASYGAEELMRFGGVEICKECREQWGRYVMSLPERAAEVFPELGETQLVLTARY